MECEWIYESEGEKFHLFAGSLTLDSLAFTVRKCL